MEREDNGSVITDLGEISVTVLSWGCGLELSGRTSRESPFGVATDLQQNHGAGTENSTDSRTKGPETILICRRSVICEY